jgi:hypothetical protein
MLLERACPHVAAPWSAGVLLYRAWRKAMHARGVQESEVCARINQQGPTPQALVLAGHSLHEGNHRGRSARF